MPRTSTVLRSVRTSGLRLPMGVRLRTFTVASGGAGFSPLSPSMAESSRLSRITPQRTRELAAIGGEGQHLAGLAQREHPHPIAHARVASPCDRGAPAGAGAAARAS